MGIVYPEVTGFVAVLASKLTENRFLALLGGKPGGAHRGFEERV